MGHNATVVLMIDSLEAIRTDPEFGKKLAEAVSEVACYQYPKDVSAHGHCNAATVVETHHADQTAIVAVGGNYGTVLGTRWDYHHHRPEDKEKILRELADDMGFTLHRKPVKA